MMTPKNECDNQISNNHQSANGHFRTPQAMMSQRPQNHQPMGVNNFTQERCYKNNIADATTMSMSSFSLARNNTPTIPSYRASLARYDRTMPSDLPQPQVSSGNTPIIPSFRANLARNSWYNSCLGSQGSADRFRNSLKTNLDKQKNFRYHPYEEGSDHKNNSSVFNDFDPLSGVDRNNFRNLENYVAPIATPPPTCPSGNTNLDSTRESTFPSYLANLAQNSSSNCLGSQGFANNFRNPSKPNLLNQKNFRYHPYGDGSNHKNDSFGYNDFDPLSRVDRNSFRNLKNYVAPIATPTPIRPSGNVNLDLTLGRTTEHRNLKNHVAPIATPPPIRPSGNANLDLTPERTTEHRMFDIRGTDAWKRLMACPNGCYEEIQTQKKELLLFKDDKNTFPTSLVIERGDATEKDDEKLDLDLNLHL
ncbi:hypothetical protein TSUD_252160 [Trifolium subterraneum]|uniref:Uncharacterized protein n=1 Tax=Trifolium subterraneum TaxID=3900 RepID=A0A2Z6LVV3_TRISU|nr:hypothetical protein TSUD_252160 [Trifolium subterraneum]